jgi:hypothetical protein
MRNIVESDMRFEHCYRIDEDPAAPPADKHACWSEWNERYTKGQERSRVAYARERLRVLGAAEEAAPASTVAAAACPPPASPYAPPPTVSSLGPGPYDPHGNKPSTIDACNEGCALAWRTCVAPCANANGCVLECDVRFKGCTKSCTAP